MKKLFLSLVFFAVTTAGFSQVSEKQDDGQEAEQDKLDQQHQPPAQMSQERAARIEAQRIQNEKAAKKREKQLAKEKAKVRTVPAEPTKQ